MIKRTLLLILLLTFTTSQAGEFSKQLRTDPPRTGRIIASDGETINEADLMRREPINIARGMYPGAEFIAAFGERTTTGAETRFPVWPDGAIKLGGVGGVQLYVVSTSAQDGPGGTGIEYLHVHYVDRNLVPVDSEIIMGGLTPVPLPQRAKFVQCAHTAERQAASAVGTITIQDGSGNVYSQIAIGETRCSSSFRIVPKGMVLYVDGAVGSSVSATADTTTQMRLVANEIYSHQYNDPLVFIPIASIGMQNGAVAFNFPDMIRYREGTVVGCTHTTNKSATVACSWFGRLEPAE
jgi:hypothetical protein